MPAVGPSLLSASLRDAASLKAVLDLVDKEYSQDAGERWCTPPAALSCGMLLCSHTQGDACSAAVRSPTSAVLNAVSMQFNKDGVQIHVIDDAQVSSSSTN